MDKPHDPLRRIDIQRMVPAEQAILNAVYEVEKLPGSPRQTAVVVKLVEARRMLADIVDGVEAKPEVPTTGSGVKPATHELTIALRFDTAGAAADLAKIAAVLKDASFFPFGEKT